MNIFLKLKSKSIVWYCARYISWYADDRFILIDPWNERVARSPICTTNAVSHNWRTCCANRKIMTRGVHYSLSNRLLKFLVLRINFLYLCFFIFSFRCLFTLIIRQICPLDLSMYSSHCICRSRILSKKGLSFRNAVLWVSAYVLCVGYTSLRKISY